MGRNLPPAIFLGCKIPPRLTKFAPQTFGRQDSPHVAKIATRILGTQDSPRLAKLASQI